MSRVFAVEKIVAVARIYHALIEELGQDDAEQIVPSALLDAAVKIALSTDTSDLGIIGLPIPEPDDVARAMAENDSLADGDHFAGMPDAGQ